MAVSYPICTALYLMWPERGIEFFNALAHGLDFAKLSSPTPFRLSQFLFPYTVLVVWAFLAGTLFSWIGNCLRGKPMGE